MIKNILKRREESDTYLTHLCGHCWSRKSLMKIDEIGAFSQHYFISYYGWELPVEIYNVIFSFFSNHQFR
jgi:hypothetical protein